MAKLILNFGVLGVAAIGDDQWHEWKRNFGVQIDAEEEEQRFKIFKANAAFIDAENNKGHTFQLALNAFAHLTNPEFQQLFTGSYSEQNGEQVLMGEHQPIGEVPSKVDWRNSTGVLQPIKDQGKCGSCWSFAATAAVESGFTISTGKSVSLSEQQLIDCDADCRNCTANPDNPEHRNGGCAGGFSRWAFNYMQNSSLCTEESYPYTGTDPQTNLNNCSAATCDVGVPAGVVQGYMTVQQNYTALNAAVAQQPVAVAVNADVYWQFYHGGIMDGSSGCQGSTNHAVTVVGYTPSSDSRFDFVYVIRNSWGATWGESGYVRIPSIYHFMPQNASQFSPSCLLETAPTFPVLQSTIVI